MTIDNITTVKTPYQRELTVTHNYSGTYLKIKNIISIGEYEQAFLTDDNAKELGTALLEAAGETIHTELGELPEVTEDLFDSCLEADGYSRSTKADPAVVLKTAKALFAIAKELQKRADAKAEEAKKAEAAKAEADLKLKLRRDELAQELGDDYSRNYSTSSTVFQRAIDRVIELEGKVEKPQRVWV